MLNDKALRDVVAIFILDSAEDGDCLSEVVADAYMDACKAVGIEYDEEVSESLCDRAYDLFGSSKIVVTIGDTVYGYNND